MTSLPSRACTLALALLLVPATAGAQAADPRTMAAAQSLFEQAVVEMDSKDYASACPKLEQTTQMLPNALGAKETLARCYEAQGRLASAWAQYGLVEALASRTGQAQRAAAAGRKLVALRPTLATLTVELPDAVRRLPGISITLDGLALGAAVWAAALAVDRGEHVIEAKAPGHRPWSRRVVIGEDGAHARVEVPLLEAEQAAPAPVTPAHAMPAPVTPAPAMPAPVTPAPAMPAPAMPAPAMFAPTAHPWQWPVGIAAVAAGATGLGATGVLAALAAGKKNASNEEGHCDARNTCDEIGLDLRAQAMQLGNGATAALVVGSVLAAGGVVLLVTAPSRKDRPETTGAVRWGIDVSPARVGVQGAW
ncbi:hypothetical protein WMF27_09730 [Sorangium sp. So ce281]|uniref:hypothetical protein n=1 Tax=unclassified Sorangium TaxID=2621164 RepID=UPI003F600850